MRAIILLILLFSSMGNRSLINMLNEASNHRIIFDESRIQLKESNLRGLEKRCERKQNKRLTILLENLEFSYNSDNDTIVIYMQYPEFGNTPIVLDASSSRCEIHFERKNVRKRAVVLQPEKASLNQALKSLNDFIDRKVVQLISKNDTTAFRELNEWFAIQVMELPPKCAYRIAIREGTVIDSNVWFFSIEPSITFWGKINPGDSLEQVHGQIEEIKNRTLSL